VFLPFYLSFCVPVLISIAVSGCVLLHKPEYP